MYIRTAISKGRAYITVTVCLRSATAIQVRFSPLPRIRNQHHEESWGKLFWHLKLATQRSTTRRCSLNAGWTDWNSSVIQRQLHPLAAQVQISDATSRTGCLGDNADRSSIFAPILDIKSPGGLESHRSRLKLKCSFHNGPLELSKYRTCWGGQKESPADQLNCHQLNVFLALAQAKKRGQLSHGFVRLGQAIPQACRGPGFLLGIS